MCISALFIIVNIDENVLSETDKDTLIIKNPFKRVIFVQSHLELEVSFVIDQLTWPFPYSLLKSALLEKGSQSHSAH